LGVARGGVGGPFAEGGAEAEDGLRVERRIARYATDSVSAKESFRHGGWN